MSVCKFIASDFPLIEFAPSRDYHIDINIDFCKSHFCTMAPILCLFLLDFFRGNKVV